MLLNQLDIDNDVESNEDFLPGDFTKDTGMYPMKVDMAFMGKSDGGAVNVTLWLKEIGGNGGHRETFYVTSKAGSNTYVDKRSGKKRLLPGMEGMNQLSIITAGKKLAAQTAEEKLVKIYNFQEKKDLPTKVEVLTEMLGAEVLVALTKKRENKRKKVGDEYINTNEEQVSNIVSKFLYPNGLTVAEHIAGQAETTYRDGWVKKFGPDYVQDRFKPVAPGAGVEAASAAAAGVNAGKVDDLFSDDDHDVADVPDSADTQA